MEITFCELKNKQVINIIDGKQLGHISDLVFNTNNTKILGFIVPANKGFNLFKSNENIFIPYQNICKMGEDVVLVEICVSNARIKGLSSPSNQSINNLNISEDQNIQNVDK